MSVKTSHRRAATRTALKAERALPTVVEAMTAVPVGRPDCCAVLHTPGYVRGECSGDIRLYRSLASTAVWWLCDLDATDSVRRTGIRLKRIDEPEMPA